MEEKYNPHHQKKLCIPGAEKIDLLQISGPSWFFQFPCPRLVPGEIKQHDITVDIIFSPNTCPALDCIKHLLVLLPHNINSLLLTKLGRLLNFVFGLFFQEEVGECWKEPAKKGKGWRRFILVRESRN